VPRELDLAFEVAEGAAQHEAIRDGADAFDEQRRRRLQKDALVGRQRVVVRERGRPFIEREEGDELRREPFAQERLAGREVEQPRFVDPRDDVVRILAEQLCGAVGWDGAAPDEEIAEGIGGGARDRHDQFALRPVEDLAKRRPEQRQVAGLPILQDLTRDHGKRRDLDPLQTHVFFILV
jgi:hypothetical protein